MNSLGAMYGYITKLLGFVPDRHEGKVTGLAARGKPSVVYDALRSAIYFKEETGEIETRYGEYYLPYMGANLESLEKLMAKVPKEDFAFAAQAVLEEVLCKYLKFYLARHHEGKAVNLCLSGGCSANVKLNFELSKLEQVDSLYVSPEMGDGGNALGGALNCMVKSSTSNYPQMPTVYLGPNYSDVEIIQACKKNNVSATQVSNEKKIAYLAKELANGKIIGWFMGRMEYGPRALGARSILASPLDASINISLNKRLNRTEFMPFAPATTEDLAEACFLQWKASDVAARFMTTCYECTDLMQAKCPATVHIDNTARPQVVRRPDNPQYYDLIAKFHEISGAPAIINTSFNHHEEPIVCSPDDAIRSYLNGNVDLLVIEDFLITETV
jgi:carbamoyltransferase